MKAPDNNDNMFNKNKKEDLNEDSLSSILLSMGITQEMYNKLSKEESNYVKELIKDAKDLNKNTVKKMISDEQDAEKLRAMVSEFLTSFMIIGYNQNDQRVIIQHTLCDKDDDSLIEALRYVFFKISGVK